jgi:ribosomal-protein-alanine acetyltransferase
VIWQIRQANVDDVDAIMAIESATFGSDAWSRESMLAELANPNTFYLAAGRDERLEGYAGLLAPRGAEQADVQTIAVLESARGSGLGRALMNIMLSEARSRRATEVFLEVRADNPGPRHLYESLGFEQVSVRKRYYRPGVDAIVMRLELPEPTVVTT